MAISVPHFPFITLPLNKITARTRLIYIIFQRGDRGVKYTPPQHGVTSDSFSSPSPISQYRDVARMNALELDILVV